jgi:hypothetical protein
MALRYPNRGIRNMLNSIVPNWLANRPPFNTGFKILYAIALAFDVLVEIMLQGLYAAMPGKGTPTALGVIGQGRGILQGLTEANSDFATRLRNWLAYWFNAGSGEILAEMLRRFLPGNPQVTIWDRSGNYAISWPNGSTSFGKDTNWNWDGVSNPERSGWWSDIWIAVYPDPWVTWEVGGGGGATGWTNNAAKLQWRSNASQWSSTISYNVGDYTVRLGIQYQSLASNNINFPPESNPGQWGISANPAPPPGGLGIGHQVPRVAVDGIYQIVSTWKGAHTFVVALMFTNISTLFQPGELLLFYQPNGAWGRWGRWSSASNAWIPARTRELTLIGTYKGHCRYWTPGNGG